MKYVRHQQSGAAILRSPEQIEQFLRKRSEAEDIKIIKNDIDTLKQEIVRLKQLLESKGE